MQARPELGSDGPGDLSAEQFDGAHQIGVAHAADRQLK